MKTVADMYKALDALIAAEMKAADRALAAAYIERRKALLAAVQELWNKAAVTPHLDATVGNMVYVSRAEAAKYGRLEALNALINENHRLGALTDISALEVNGVKLYTNNYYGYTWIYEEGHLLPITAGAPVKLAAKAVYSDFSGATAAARVRANLGKAAEDILSTVTRGLNQGNAYGITAQAITDQMDMEFARALRIAHTESHRIQNQAYVDGLGMLDKAKVPYEKEWFKLANGPGKDNREDHFEMNGKVADENGIFHLPSGATGPAPGLTGSAKEDINCGCSVITIIDGQRPEEVRLRDEGFVPYDQYLANTKGVTLSAVRKNK